MRAVLYEAAAAATRLAESQGSESQPGTASADAWHASGGRSLTVRAALPRYLWLRPGRFGSSARQHTEMGETPTLRVHLKGVCHERVPDRHSDDLFVGVQVDEL
jgi:hypothetical protein